MANREVAAPEENCEYSVVLGRSLFAEAENGVLADATDAGDAMYALFQYKFTPASVDTAIPGLVSIDESSGATVLRGTTAKADGGIPFKGKVAEQKETECLLIFDGTSFRLERCDYSVSQLRHVRAAPIQRPRPSSFVTPATRKNLHTGFARRMGKIITRPPKPSAKPSSEAKSQPAAEPVAGGTNEASIDNSVADVPLGPLSKRRKKAI